jgi:hypothetical protein
MSNLSSRAMLASLKISMWSASKHDRKVSDEVAAAKQANRAAGKYTKILIAKAALAQIKAAATEARSIHYRYTLPWTNEGQRILTSSAYQDYAEEMRQAKARFIVAVDNFVREYPYLKDEAKTFMGDLWDENDYPHPNVIQDQFLFDIQIMPMSEATDFRVKLSDDEIKRIQDDIQAKIDETVKLATREAWTRTYELVTHMAERLAIFRKTEESGTENRFHDTLVENVRDMAELLPKLNITGDSQMDVMARKISSTIGAYNPEDLRNSPNLRYQAITEAKTIADELKEFMGES